MSWLLKSLSFFYTVDHQIHPRLQRWSKLLSDCWGMQRWVWCCLPCQLQCQPPVQLQPHQYCRAIPQRQPTIPDELCQESLLWGHLPAERKAADTAAVASAAEPAAGDWTAVVVAAIPGAAAVPAARQIQHQPDRQTIRQQGLLSEI